MPSTNRAIITPEVLAWARNHLRMQADDAARKVGVSPERLAEWEQGQSHPTAIFPPRIGGHHARIDLKEAKKMMAEK